MNALAYEAVFQVTTGYGPQKLAYQLDLAGSLAISMLSTTIVTVNARPNSELTNWSMLL